MKMTLLIVQWNKKENVPFRNLILPMCEEFTYQPIERYVDQGSNFNGLCLKLDCASILRSACVSISPFPIVIIS